MFLKNNEIEEKELFKPKSNRNTVWCILSFQNILKILSREHARIIYKNPYSEIHLENTELD
jgi:hypothetical protein